MSISPELQKKYLTRTLEQMWQDYQKAVLPKDAPAVQIVESRRCFMAGSITMFFKITGLADYPDSVAEGMMRDIQKQVDAYENELKRLGGLK